MVVTLQVIRIHATSVAGWAAAISGLTLPISMSFKGILPVVTVDS